MRKLLHEGSVVWTDELKSYTSLRQSYSHSTVNHSKKQFVSKSGISTNAAEGLWSCLKRTIRRIWGKIPRSQRFLSRRINFALFLYICSALGEDPLQKFLVELMRRARGL